MAWYGSDKPDLHNPIKMQDVSARFRDGGFGLFAKILGTDAENRCGPSLRRPAAAARSATA
ncbi:hypothetical protein ACRAWD_00015 [Caulobacter segnis]